MLLPDEILSMWEKRWRPDADNQLSEKHRESFRSKQTVHQLTAHTKSEVGEAIEKYQKLDDIVPEARRLRGAREANSKAKVEAAAKVRADRAAGQARADAAAKVRANYKARGSRAAGQARADFRAKTKADLKAKSRARADFKAKANADADADADDTAKNTAKVEAPRDR
jgi:colicin import membrane protein